MPGLRSYALSVALIALTGGAMGGLAQAQDLPPMPVAAAPPPSTAAPPPANPAPTLADQKLSEGQLDQLVAPVSLYPDPVLSQVLMASTYPLEVVEGDRWVRDPAHKALTGEALTAALKAQNWDPSVMALVPFPRVLGVMAAQLRWTEQLGNAFLAQQADVMSAVQRLRHAAMAAGNLKATPECHCVIQTSGDIITILPAEPKVVSVPVYDPTVVYGAWPAPDYPPFFFAVPVGFDYPPGYWIGFEPPIELAVFGPLWGWGSFDWRGGRILAGGGAWVHDPAHRGGVAYNNATVQARFGAGQRAAVTGAARTGSPNGGRFGAARSGAPVGGARNAVVGGAGISHRSFAPAGAGFRGPAAFHSAPVARGAAPHGMRGPVGQAHFSPNGGGHSPVAHAVAPHGGGGHPGGAAQGGHHR